MKLIRTALVFASCSFLASADLLGARFSLAKPDARLEAAAQASDEELSPEQELAAVQKSLFADRPYKINYGGISEVFVLKILPTAVRAPDVPDWWSDKQGYDIARLFALALAKYPVFKIVPPETWDERAVRLEAERSGALAALAAPVATQVKRTSARGSSAVLGNKELSAGLNVLDYGFQYMPVKRRGIGFGFVALNSKECSTETYFKSQVFLGRPHAELKPMANPVLDATGLEDEQSLVIDRLIVDKTGGASLNLNFIVGGAGGGNFAPPDKPLKQIIYQSVVDAAEAAFCLATNQQQCLEYYKNRPQSSLTKLNAKQKKKVGSC